MPQTFPKLYKLDLRALLQGHENVAKSIWAVQYRGLGGVGITGVIHWNASVFTSLLMIDNH